MIPDVSIVIPTFARPRETQRAIRSALAQDDLTVEVIVVDDASPVPLELPPQLADSGRVRLVRLSENSGPAIARNVGVDASAAPYIGFLDSDDFFLPNTLHTRLDFAKQRKLEPQLTCAGVWRWSPARSATLMIPAQSSKLSELASGCWYFPGSTALFSRETWERIGPLNPSIRRLEDPDWGIRLGMAGGRLSVWPEPAAVVTHAKAAQWKLVQSAVNHLKQRFGPNGETRLTKAEYRRLSAYLALELAASARGEHRVRRLVWHLLSSYALMPRASLHLGNWWAGRPSSADELHEIEDLSVKWGE